MAHTTAALLGRGQFSVAIAGATGRLGEVVTRTFASPPFRAHFSRVVALTRDATSTKATQLREAGAEVVQVSFEGSPANLLDALKGVDVVLNVLGGSASVAAKDGVAKAAVDSGAVVYFPSEFGVDHRVNDFGDFENKEWIKKQDHLRFVQEYAANKGRPLRIVPVYTGLFLELSLGPWFGLDIQPSTSESVSTLTSYGPTSARAGFTSTSDVARALAQLVVLASTSWNNLSESVGVKTGGADVSVVHVRIQGSAYSFEDIARVIEEVRGKGKVELKSESLRDVRDRTREGYLGGTITTPVDHIRILIGEGRIDFSSDNQNEVVNPKESVWKWKTVEEYLKETL